MAAAVLGHAARRLGGGGALRQTQEAAVSRLSSTVQRRLMPRFAHTEVQNPCDCGKFKKDSVMKGIQKQKEELYDSLAEAHKMYGTGTALLRELSIHVNRSSGDATWEWARAAKTKSDLLKLTGFVALVGGGTCLYFKMLFWCLWIGRISEGKLSFSQQELIAKQ